MHAGDNCKRYISFVVVIKDNSCGLIFIKQRPAAVTLGMTYCASITQDGTWGSESNIR